VTRHLERKGFTTLTKLKHDIEQLEHLQATAAVSSTVIAAPLAALRAARNRLLTSPQHQRGKILLRVPPPEREALRGVYNRVLHLQAAHAVLPRRALGPQNFGSLEDLYLGSDPEAIYIDNFLSREALGRLYRFCTDSTVWFDVKPNGYVGAYADDGFSTPLLYQIADELQAAFPRLLKGEKLVHMWAYKYDSEERGGIKVHADVAKVNINFWLTEDDANLDPSSGGLVVYRVQPKKNPDGTQEFADFNSEAGLQRAMSTIQGDAWRNLTVPYRQNRMVMFNSNLWHRTDRFHFKPGYKKRRINITMLFGARGDIKEH